MSALALRVCVHDQGQRPTTWQFGRIGSCRRRSGGLGQSQVGGGVRGHLSVSLPLLSSPTLPLSICISPTPLYHLQGPHPQSQRLLYSKSDDFLDVDSPKVVDILSPLPLTPQQHQTSLGRIGTCPCDTMAPSTITWTAINGRLGTGRLGIAISVYYV
jgi:hypothetical protein